ncbi:Uncharacterized protein TOPH_07661 [Tolypocladium ophioglossoides CBS 100239]|uniref:NAD-dependent epimerase/dehydratase domain-containing protein n=1 Tax=Tolypocladium ophioglossoides (strain CBS 100239) TaxID=1163406 RepID=A0A0L0N0T1_TOLOC|nr:Uncharacterized protein TOPH_07661 [Tolypocladium ophioglossoides CBS 100239]
MKLLITGAGGFVGQALAQDLLNDGHKVILTDIVEPTIPQVASNNYHNATCITADLHDEPEAVLSKDLDAVYILHGIMSAGSEHDFDLGYRVNLHSTLRLLEAIRNICPGVRLIYASSCAAYGLPLPPMPSEATVCTPQSSYGIQKVMIEEVINDYNRRGHVVAFTLRLPSIMVRPGKPTQAASSWMSGVIREPLQGKESILPCPDDFKCWLCSVKTLVKNMKLALTFPGDCMPPHIRQVLLPGITETVGSMLGTLKEVGGEEVLKFIKREDASTEIKAMIDSWPFEFDISKALGIGFAPDQPFRDTVEDFAKTLKDKSA